MDDDDWAPLLAPGHDHFKISTPAVHHRADRLESLKRRALDMEAADALFTLHSVSHDASSLSIRAGDGYDESMLSDVFLLDDTMYSRSPSVEVQTNPPIAHHTE